MSTTSPRRFVTGLIFGLAAALALLPTGAILLRTYGPSQMWLGFLTGGGVATVLVFVALWRSWRHPESVTTAERVVGPGTDERDKAVRSRALAVVGGISIPLTSAASIAVAVGAPSDATLTILLWALLIVLALAFLRAARTM